MNTNENKKTNLEFWSPRQFDAKGDYRLHGTLLNAGSDELAALTSYFCHGAPEIKVTKAFHGFYVWGLRSQPIFVCTAKRACA